jgi:hypothetical protein
MSKALTPASVRESVRDAVAGIIEEYQDQPDTDRDTVIERLDEELTVSGATSCAGA